MWDLKACSVLRHLVHHGLQQYIKYRNNIKEDFNFNTIEEKDSDAEEHNTKEKKKQGGYIYVECDLKKWENPASTTKLENVVSRKKLKISK